jgi:threonine/homoserine/homoserine lactone efflux protein
MAGVFITVVVLGLVASLSPVVVATTASQLTRPWPVARALAVFGGVAMGVALLELMAFGLLAGLTALISGGNGREIRIAMDLLAGGLLLYIVYRLWTGARAAKTSLAASEPDPTGESEPRPLKRLFVLGFTLMFFNPRVLLMITGAVTQIRALDTRIGAAIHLIVLFVVVNLFPAAPVAAYLVSPRFAAEIPGLTERAEVKSKPVIAKARSFQAWLLADHRTLVMLLTFTAGMLLVARGIGL